jgi:LPXTG-motif cell wall-anchored protein
MGTVRRLLTLAVVASGLLVSGASMAAAAEPNAIPPPVVTFVRVLPNNALPVTGNDSSNLGILLVGSAVAAAGIVVFVLARSRRRPSKFDS